MEKELDPVVIKATQTSLGKFVKRPPLTEKLLKKPPFRFLHDIVTSVLKSTGFFENLFDEQELISDNVKDRESKIIFLNKVITVVGLTIGKTLSVKPSKIVAGQEPDKTNELLQCLAHALDKKLSSVEAVKKYKEGVILTKSDDKKPQESVKSNKKANDASKLTSKSSEKLISHKKEVNARSTKNENDKINQKVKQKEKHIVKTEPTAKNSQQTKPNNKRPPITKKEVSIKKEETVDNLEVISKSNVVINEIDIEINDANIEVTDSIQNKSLLNNEDSFQEPNLNSSYTINNLNSSLSSQDLTENDKNNGLPVKQDVLDNSFDNKEILENDKYNNGIHDIENNIKAENATVEAEIKIKEIEKKNIETDLRKSPAKVKNSRPLSVRPSSSRPGAPRLRDKHDNIVTENENILVGKVNIIAENAQNEEEEDTSIVIVDRELEFSKESHDQQEQLHSSLNQHGHLVQQILDSQKEYSQISGKTEIEWEFGAQKARDAISKEIEKLRYDIQALSRVANPLGKLMDHIQEDVEVMRQELQQWTKTYEEASKELAKQKAANEESLFPLYTKLKQLNTDITEKNEKINDLKILIHKNSIRIEKLLSNGNVQ